jgi:hypothetical protein
MNPGFISSREGNVISYRKGKGSLWTELQWYLIYFLKPLINEARNGYIRVESVTSVIVYLKHVLFFHKADETNKLISSYDLITF